MLLNVPGAFDTISEVIDTVVETVTYYPVDWYA